MPVCHLLKKPIVATYVRIIPLAWSGHIALRAGFYGCKSGKQLQLSVAQLKIFSSYTFKMLGRSIGYHSTKYQGKKLYQRVSS